VTSGGELIEHHDRQDTTLLTGGDQSSEIGYSTRR
jgi:hypothetical protein